MSVRQSIPPTRPARAPKTSRRRSRARRWLPLLVLVLVAGGLVAGALLRPDLLRPHTRRARATLDETIAETKRRAHEVALALTETLPVYRVQLRTTTCDLPAAGTDNAVRVRLNRTNSTWLDYSQDDFRRGASFTYDLGLDDVTVLEDISMLEISKTGRDGWCLRRVQLFVNDGLIFNRRYSGPGRWLSHIGTDTRTLTIHGRELRRNRNWDAYAPSLPPARLERSEIESRIESAVGSALHGQRVTWRRVPGRAVRLDRRSRLTYAGSLALTLKLDNWADPNIDVGFVLAIACDEGRLEVRVRGLQFDVHSPWYSDLATLGILDREIERTLRIAASNAALKRDTRVVVCPPALEILPDGDLRLY